MTIALALLKSILKAVRKTGLKTVARQLIVQIMKLFLLVKRKLDLLIGRLTSIDLLDGVHRVAIAFVFGRCVRTEQLTVDADVFVLLWQRRR